MLKIKLIKGRDYSKYVKVYKDENGKPYLEDSKNYVSISHQDNFTLVAISNKPIGIDIERVRKYKESMNNYLGLSEKVVTSKYKFFKEWTKREAYIKRKNLKLGEIRNLDKMEGKFRTFFIYPYVVSLSY